MSHELDTSTGRAALAYVGETPWHGLGEQLPEGQPIDVWVKAARLDWSLKRLPAQYLVEGTLRTVEDRFVLARSDTNAALSVVSADYQIVQPTEVLEFYRDLVAAYGYKLETAGALNGGRKVWALARTGRTANLSTTGGRPDDIAAFLLLATSCDKTLATTATFTSIRVVCKNTLSFAIQDIAANKRRHIKVPHTRRFDPGHLRRELGHIDKAWEAFLNGVRRMEATPMEPARATSFFERLLQTQKDKPLSPRAKQDHQTLVGLFTAAPGQDLDTSKHTLWGAVNAVTYYVDHVRPSTGGDRLDSAWFGRGSLLKDRAWDMAMELVRARKVVTPD